MKYKTVNDSRTKKGMTVYNFEHTLKNGRHINGCFLEKKFFFGKDEAFHRVCAYVKQGDMIVALLTGFLSDWDHFFNEDCLKYMKKQCRTFNTVLREEIIHFAEVVEDSFDLDEDVFNDISSTYRFYGHENGFIFVDKFWVHPHYRKQGYAKSIIRFLNKRYECELCYVFNTQPLQFEPEDMRIKDRLIRVDSFDKLCTYINDSSKYGNNLSIIYKLLGPACVIAHSTYFFGPPCGRSYAVAMDRRLCEKIEEYDDLPF